MKNQDKLLIPWWFRETNKSLVGRDDRGKRVFDILVSLALLPLLLILGLIVCFWALFVVKRPIFFLQYRVCKNEKIFKLIKFRSMILDAEENGLPWTLPWDSRIIPGMRLIRKIGLDETPQIFNILKGDIGLVGPRACSVEVFKQFQKIPGSKLRYKVRPGMTGLSQVLSGRFVDSEQIWEMTSRIDNLYIQNHSYWNDIMIIITTIPMLLKEVCKK